ncbi:MAG: hypothetical protein H8D26_03155 [Methanomicrobia archaeon]|nr:hypothetical protein [Methanomicrobia archaeon]
MTAKNKKKKWGKVGAPNSKKRKEFLDSIRHDPEKKKSKEVIVMEEEVIDDLEDVSIDEPVVEEGVPSVDEGTVEGDIAGVDQGNDQGGNAKEAIEGGNGKDNEGSDGDQRVEEKVVVVEPPLKILIDDGEEQEDYVESFY